ncbi:MAG TPA: hypothetical protein PK920_15445, partial [Phycisphaerae bacterium]|nr:hypothetical protein [Phycisphaerae bacterium]
PNYKVLMPIIEKVLPIIGRTRLRFLAKTLSEPACAPKNANAGHGPAILRTGTIELSAGVFADLRAGACVRFPARDNRRRGSGAKPCAAIAAESRPPCRATIYVR